MRTLAHTQALNLLAEVGALLGAPKSFDGLRDDDTANLTLRVPIGLVRRLGNAIPEFAVPIIPFTVSEEDGDHIMDLAEWRAACTDGDIMGDEDGFGYYAKGGFYSKALPASAFDYTEDPPLGATHVVWFNR